MWRRGESGTVSTQKQWWCTAYLHCCVLSASLSVIEARGGNCLKWAKISLQWPNLWFPFSSCSSSGLWRLFHMQTPYSPPPPLNPTFLFPNPLIPSPPHLRQQYPSRRTAPLSTGFCGIYSNILTFRLPSLPEQKWFVTAGDGLGRRSFLQHRAFLSLPVLLCRKADFSPSTTIFLSLLLYSLLLLLSAGEDLESSSHFFFIWLHSVIDKLGDIPLFVDILCLLSFFCAFCSVPTYCLILYWHHVWQHKGQFSHGFSSESSEDTAQQSHTFYCF